MDVKALPCNGWGLYQMHGNVWEWCADRYADYPAQAVTDPIGSNKGMGRTSRGGSWRSDDTRVRSSFRNHSSPSNRSHEVGFRLALGQKLKAEPVEVAESVAKANLSDAAELNKQIKRKASNSTPSEARTSGTRKRINLEIEIPTQTRYLGLIGNIGEQLAWELTDYGGDRDTLAFNINLVLTEALTNVIKHSGYKNQALRVCISIEGDSLSIQVHDQGLGFDLDGVPCPDSDELTERGRGIYIIRHLMDSVDYRKTENGNVLEMKKEL